jgi:hypothetical protein
MKSVPCEAIGTPGLAARGPWWVAGLAAGLLALATSPAGAQQSTPAQPQGAAPVSDIDASEIDVGLPDSVEQGHTQMDTSFTPQERRERIRFQRRKAFEDTKFDAEIRSFELNRTKFDDSQIGAWAIGGSAGARTGYFRDLFFIGVTGYTSQPLWAPEDKDGTLLLAPGQEHYTVLGEYYGEFKLHQDVRLDVGAKGIDTPYLNRNDNRMTPQTFTQVTMLGTAGGGAEGTLAFGAGYFDKEKGRNSDEFVNMGRIAGASVDRGVYTAGVNYKASDWTLGFIDYYSADLINIAYAEAKYTLVLANERNVKFAAQYSDQRSTGENLLTGSSFSTDQFGIKAEYAAGRALFTTAWTATGKGDAIRAPWSSHPGYTSIQVQDFDRAGEDAFMLRAAYNPEPVPGLGLYVLWVKGSQPRDPAQFAQQETDLNAQWTPPSGNLKGLMVRLRYAHVRQDNDTTTNDFRFMVYYTFQKL